MIRKIIFHENHFISFYQNQDEKVKTKILYVLDKDTMKGGKYYEITKLSAKCSAQRLVPDYLGLKKHLKLKGVLTFPMGK